MTRSHFARHAQFPAARDATTKEWRGGRPALPPPAVGRTRDQHQRSFPMLLKTKALTTTLLSGLCVSAMAAAQESRPAGQTPPPAESGVATPAVGQPDTTATPEAAGKRAAEETITVTGSRIRRKDLTTPAPVTVISREQVIASGKVSIGDFLQSLPEQGNSINTSVNNGGDGS